MTTVVTYVKDRLPEPPAQAPVTTPNDYFRLTERIVRVEEAIKNLLIDKRFEAMEKRFEAVDKVNPRSIKLGRTIQKCAIIHGEHRAKFPGHIEANRCVYA